MNDQLLRDNVVLVNERDVETGFMPKMEAHEKGLLHRAFSVFVFNSKGELLLQQRASTKYHSPALWSNTCCSHPYPGEEVHDAARRRLREEMGFTCSLHKVFDFVYKAQVDRGLTEHEFDHVFFGTTNTYPKINQEEVRDWKYVSLESLEQDIKKFPQDYTEWLKIVFDRVLRFKKDGHV